MRIFWLAVVLAAFMCTTLAQNDPLTALKTFNKKLPNPLKNAVKTKQISIPVNNAKTKKNSQASMTSNTQNKAKTIDPNKNIKQKSKGVAPPKNLKAAATNSIKRNNLQSKPLYSNKLKTDKTLQKGVSKAAQNKVVVPKKNNAVFNVQPIKQKVVSPKGLNSAYLHKGTTKNSIPKRSQKFLSRANKLESGTVADQTPQEFQESNEGDQTTTTEFDSNTDSNVDDTTDNNGDVVDDNTSADSNEDQTAEATPSEQNDANTDQQAVATNVTFSDGVQGIPILDTQADVPTSIHGNYSVWNLNQTGGFTIGIMSGSTVNGLPIPNPNTAAQQQQQITQLGDAQLLRRDVKKKLPKTPTRQIALRPNVQTVPTGNKKKVPAKSRK